MLLFVKGDPSCRAWEREESRGGQSCLKTALAETNLGKAQEEQQEVVTQSRTPLPNRRNPPSPTSSSYALFPYYIFSLTDLVSRVHFAVVGEKQQLLSGACNSQTLNFQFVSFFSDMSCFVKCMCARGAICLQDTFSCGNVKCVSF